MEKIIENLCAEFLPKGRDLSTFKPKEILHLQMAFEQGAIVMMNYLKNIKEDKTNEKLINDIRESSLLKEEQLEPIENALYATKHFTTSQATELAEGILIYIQDHDCDIVKISKNY